MGLKIGTPVTASDFQKPFRQILDDLVEMGYTLYESFRPYMRKSFDQCGFEINITDRPELNACTTTCNDTYKVHVFRGAVEHIFGTMLGLLSCPTFLPEIGNAAREVTPSICGGAFLPMPLLRNVAAHHTQVDVPIPSDSVRTTIAHLLSTIALDFLLSHEIGHIIAGHHEILHSFGMNTTISEYQSGRGPTERYALRQVLECDADAFACHTSSGVHTHDKMANIVRELANATTWPATQAAHVMYLTAIGALFRALNVTAPARIEANKTAHPHPAVRGLIVTCCTVARSLHGKLLAQSEVESALFRSVRNIEDVWVELFLPGQNPEPPLAWFATLWDQSRKLFDLYASEESRLENYAHVPRRWHDWEWPTN